MTPIIVVLLICNVALAGLFLAGGVYGWKEVRKMLRESAIMKASSEGDYPTARLLTGIATAESQGKKVPAEVKEKEKKIKNTSENVILTQR